MPERTLVRTLGGVTREQAAAVSLPELAGRVRPVALAGERVLPVAAVLEPLLPDGGLRRGSVVTVGGSRSLALALVAAASEAGSWCAAVVRESSLGLLAAAEAGISWSGSRW